MRELLPYLGAAVAVLTALLTAFTAHRASQGRPVFRNLFNQLWLYWHGRHGQITIRTLFYSNGRRWVCMTCGAKRWQRKA